MKYYQILEEQTLPTFLRSVSSEAKPTEQDKLDFAEFMTTFLKIENATSFSHKIESLLKEQDSCYQAQIIVDNSEVVERVDFGSEKEAKEYAAHTIRHFDRHKGQMSNDQINKYLERSEDDFHFTPDYQRQFFQTVIAERSDKDELVRDKGMEEDGYGLVREGRNEKVKSGRFAQVFRNPAEVMKKSQDYRNVEEILKTDPQKLGKLKGYSILGKATQERKFALNALNKIIKMCEDRGSNMKLGKGHNLPRQDREKFSARELEIKSRYAKEYESQFRVLRNPAISISELLGEKKGESLAEKESLGLKVKF